MKIELIYAGCTEQIDDSRAKCSFLLGSKSEELQIINQAPQKGFFLKQFFHPDQQIRHVKIQCGACCQSYRADGVAYVASFEGNAAVEYIRVVDIEAESEA